MKRILLTTVMISLAGLLSLIAQERIYTPQLSLPLNNAVDQAPNVLLDWNAVTGGNTGIIKYDVQLDEDPGFASPVNFQTELVTAVQTSNLFFGQTYYWRVRALDGNDVSDWSETWSFRVIRRVVLTLPQDASLQNDTVRFQWTAISGVTEYDYQFDTVYFWKSVNSGQTANLFASFVVDENNAWIAGAGGLMLYYNGTSWTTQPSTLTTDIYGLYFVDASNGWAVGKGGKIIHFNGTEWSQQSSGITTDIQAVYMLDNTRGWAVGKSGVVLSYDGSAWTTAYTATKDLNAVNALDASHVWAVGKNQHVVFFNGSSWAVQETGGTLKEFSGIAMVDANNGWIIGKTGTIFQYTNGSWTQYQHDLTTKDLTGIVISAPDNGYAVGKTGTLLYFDGVDWSSQSATVNTNFNAVGFAGTTGFITGENGTVIAYNDEAFTSPMATVRHIGGDKTSVKISELLFGTQYYWRMRTKHSLDESIWSGARSFNTRATIVPEKPTNNSSDAFLNVTLQWKKQMSDDVSYEILVDDDPAYGSPILLATTNNTIEAELLKFGHEYNWKARAVHAFDYSDWSESWKFTTINTVTLLEPANNATEIKLSPLLKWVGQTGIAGYQVFLADNSNFNNPLATSMVPADEPTFIVPIVLEKDAVYYWRVRAVNGLDTSGFSSTWSFRTTPPVGIDEPGRNSFVTVYPNPAKDQIYFELFDHQPATFIISLSDLTGIKVLESQMAFMPGVKSRTMDVSTIPEGMYLLRISDKENSFTKKLIIKR